MPAAGTTALYRPVPRDFDEVFVRIGWTDIEDHYGAHAKTVVKWLDLRNAARAVEGLPRLQQERAAHVRRFGAAKSPVRVNYVMSRTNRRHRLATVTKQQVEG